jgi:hypothetical protein
MDFIDDAAASKHFIPERLAESKTENSKQISRNMDATEIFDEGTAYLMLLAITFAREATTSFRLKMEMQEDVRWEQA